MSDVPQYAVAQNVKQLIQNYRINESEDTTCQQKR